MQLARASESKMALGCDVNLTLVFDKTKHPNAESIFAKLWLEIFNFEKSFSRFLPSSELTRFNLNAGKSNKLSTEFEKLLKSSLLMSKITNGLHNPFVLPALQRFGYDKSFVGSYKGDLSYNNSAGFIAPYDSLIVKNNHGRIPSETSIDMGGCGKGYLADKLGSFAQTLDIEGFCFSLGGDIIANGFDENMDNWHISVQDALYVDDVLSLDYEVHEKISIATSGTIVRRGMVNRTKWHHIIDPRTQKPANSDILLATVIAENTLKADVLATCAVILGSKNYKILNEMGAEELLLQTDSGDIIGFGKLYDQLRKENEVVCK